VIGQLNLFQEMGDGPDVVEIVAKEIEDDFRFYCRTKDPEERELKFAAFVQNTFSTPNGHTLVDVPGFWMIDFNSTGATLTAGDWSKTKVSKAKILSRLGIKEQSKRR